jgi:hypothetical protein
MSPPIRTGIAIGSSERRMGEKRERPDPAQPRIGSDVVNAVHRGVTYAQEAAPALDERREQYSKERAAPGYRLGRSQAVA